MTQPTRANGFTLIEALVSLAIISLIVVVLLSATQATGDIFKRSNDQVETFQTARAAFQDMVKEIGQATLNTRWDYDDPNNPVNYRRTSDLHFVSGPDLAGTPGTGHGVFFVAPFAWGSNPDFARAGGLLSAWGYFIEYGSDLATRPSAYNGPERNRFRLMRLAGRTENLAIHETRGANEFSWFESEITAGRAAPVAENVVALILWPKLSEAEDPAGSGLTSDYTWNSRTGANDSPQPPNSHQLPPLIQVTAVFISEKSAQRMGNSSTPPPELASLMTGLFQESTAQKYEEDLRELEGRIQAISPPVEYRILSETVIIRENKWSS